MYIQTYFKHICILELLFVKLCIFNIVISFALILNQWLVIEKMSVKLSIKMKNNFPEEKLEHYTKHS